VGTVPLSDQGVAARTRVRNRQDALALTVVLEPLVQTHMLDLRLLRTQAILRELREGEEVLSNRVVGADVGVSTLLNLRFFATLRLLPLLLRSQKILLNLDYYLQFQ